MQKRFKTIREYHVSDSDISVRALEGNFFRVGLLSEISSDVKFTSTDRNGIVVDLSGTKNHFTRMDGIESDMPTQPMDVCFIPPGLEVHFAWKICGDRQQSIMLEFDSRMIEQLLPELNSERLMQGHLVPANFAQRPDLAALILLLAREVDTP